MSASVKLTVICVFSEPHLIETTLTSVYELKETPFELIIVNDGAGPEASTIIQSLTEYYDHDETFFFENELSAGVGVRVNDVLSTITGDYLWIVNSLGRIEEKELKELIKEMQNSEALLTTVLDEIPGDLTSWMEAISSSNEVQRLGLIWKWNAIPSNQKFIDPYLRDSVGFELIWRLDQCPYVSRKPWFLPAIEEQEIEHWALKRELALHWLRNYALDSNLKESLFQVLNSTDVEAFDQARSQAESLLDKAREAYAKQNFVRALNFAREAYQQEPLNDVIRTYYLELLKYLGRHVEADELNETEESGEESFELTETEIDDEENEFEFRQQFDQFSEKIDNEVLVDDSDVVDEIIGEEEPKIGKVIEPKEIHAQEILDQEIPEAIAQYNESEKVKYSVVIPTTGYGLGLLEDCFESLMNVIDKDITEVIVIDNACLDDTYAYLEDLQSKKVARLEVITNRMNKGFAASVNQGIDKAKGEFVLILHNDCIVSIDIFHELVEIFNSQDDAGAVVPMLSISMNDDQDKEHSRLDKAEPLHEISHCDSACILIKKKLGFRFDEIYGLAYFEDIDFCQQILQAEKKIYLTTQIEIEHRYGSTTGMLGLSPESDYYALNMAKFNKKWGFEPVYDQKYNQLRELDRVLMITSLMNPVDPEKHLFVEFQNNFTDEVKTQIVKTEWDEEYAISIASMLMKTDQRDILRKHETQLEKFILPISLVKQLVQYYFERNIYSRCIHYLSIYGNDPNFTDAAMYQLKIYLGDRMLEEAAQVLGSLFEVIPSNPELYKLTGDFHQFQNNTEEAKQFYEIANQIDPFRFGKPKGSVSFI